MLNTSRDLDLQLACFSCASLPVAGLAGSIDRFPFTVAMGTGPAKREKALGDANFSAAPAICADFLSGTFFCARSMAIAARFLARDLKVKGLAGKHLGKFKLDRIFQVGPSLLTAAPPSARNKLLNSRPRCLFLYRSCRRCRILYGTISRPACYQPS